MPLTHEGVDFNYHFENEKFGKEKILVNSNLVLLMAVGELLNFDACKLQLKLILLVTPCYVNYIMFLSQSLFCFLFVLTFLFL